MPTHLPRSGADKPSATPLEAPNGWAGMAAGVPSRSRGTRVHPKSPRPNHPVVAPPTVALLDPVMGCRRRRSPDGFGARDDPGPQACGCQQGGQKWDGQLARGHATEEFRDMGYVAQTRHKRYGHFRHLGAGYFCGGGATLSPRTSLRGRLTVLLPVGGPSSIQWAASSAARSDG